MAQSPNPNQVYPPMALGRRNRLALVSMLVSFVFPIGVALNVIAATFPGAVGPPGLALNTLGDVIDLLGIPALFAAIVTGHIALSLARQYPPQQARRGLAITGLALGYLSLVVCLSTIVAFIIWISVHGIVIHSFP